LKALNVHLPNDQKKHIEENKDEISHRNQQPKEKKEVDEIALQI